MDWMAHEPIESVETPNSVMHGMKPPQERIPVAQHVNDHEGKVGDHDRDQPLNEERPFGRPNALEGKEPDNQRD